jgi:hypothetical protein
MITALRPRFSRPERLSTDEWRPCAYESAKDRTEWGHPFGHHPSRRLLKRRKNKGRIAFPGSQSLSMHSAKCNQHNSPALENASSLSEDEFNLLADKWETETRNMSSPKAIIGHPAVQEIIDWGEDAVPMILRRMASRPCFWFAI